MSPLPVLERGIFRAGCLCSCVYARVDFDRGVEIYVRDMTIISHSHAGQLRDDFTFVVETLTLGGYVDNYSHLTIPNGVTYLGGGTLNFQRGLRHRHPWCDDRREYHQHGTH